MEQGDCCRATWPYWVAPDSGVYRASYRRLACLLVYTLSPNVSETVSEHSSCRDASLGWIMVPKSPTKLRLDQIRQYLWLSDLDLPCAAPPLGGS